MAQSGERFIKQGTITAGQSTVVVSHQPNKRVNIKNLLGTMNVAGTLQILNSNGGNDGDAITPAFDLPNNGPLVIKDFTQLESKPGQGIKFSAATGNFKYVLEYELEG
jgi:hypothetical protein